MKKAVRTIPLMTNSRGIANQSAAECTGDPTRAEVEVLRPLFPGKVNCCSR